MARVHFVKKARKDNKKAGIRKGESYFWWQFAYAPKSYSKTAPKRQQLTRSDFMISLYDLEDRISELEPSDIEDLKSEVESIVSDIRDLASEQEEKKSNMPDSLQESDSGQLLEERHNELESWADELEGVDLDIDEDEIKQEVADDMDIELKNGEPPEDKEEDFRVALEEKMQEALTEKLDEIKNVSHSL